MSCGVGLEKQQNKRFLIFTAYSRHGDWPFASLEKTMHIHGNSMSVHAANFYSATQEEKAAAALRSYGCDLVVPIC
jgi:hypothetical protein